MRYEEESSWKDGRKILRQKKSYMRNALNELNEKNVHVFNSFKINADVTLHLQRRSINYSRIFQTSCQNEYNQQRQRGVCSANGRFFIAHSDVFRVIFEEWMGNASNENRQFSATASFYKIAHNGSHVFSRALSLSLPETWNMTSWLRVCVLAIRRRSKEFRFLSCRREFILFQLNLNCLRRIQYQTE